MRMTAMSSSGDAPDEGGVLRRAVAELHAQVRGPLDHVVVRQHEPVGLDDHARAGAAVEARLLPRLDAHDRRLDPRDDRADVEPSTGDAWEAGAGIVVVRDRDAGEEEAGADDREHDRGAHDRCASTASGRSGRRFRAAAARARSTAGGVRRRASGPTPAPAVASASRRAVVAVRSEAGSATEAARERAAGSRSARPSSRGAPRPDDGPRDSIQARKGWSQRWCPEG